MKVENFVGERGTGFEQNRDQGSVKVGIVEAGEMLRCSLSSFAGELQEAVLMDELGEVRAQLKAADVL